MLFPQFILTAKLSKSVHYKRIKKLGSGNFGDVILVESNLDTSIYNK